MLTCLEGQGTTAKNRWNDSSAADYSVKYVSDTNGSGICINGGGLLTNQLTCEDTYCLAAGSWPPATIALDEDLVNQIAEDVMKNLIKQKDPLEKNLGADDVEIPPMPGFVEI